MMTGTYTLDKLVVMMRIDGAGLQGLLRRLSGGASRDYGVIAKDWFSTRVGGYKYNYSIELDKGVSYYLGVQRWNDAPSEYRVNIKLEFNPAKVGKYLEFNAFYNELLLLAHRVDFGRFDVAIDIPISRECVQLRKDQRRYLDYFYSKSNRTEYLGLRSEHGNVKVYNKALELGVPDSLTRVEITLDYELASWFEFKRIFPDVFYFDSVPAVDSVGGTDYVLLLACMDDINRLSFIPVKRRKKIEQLLQAAAQTLEPDEVQFRFILHDILGFGKGMVSESFVNLESDAGAPNDFLLKTDNAESSDSASLN